MKTLGSSITTEKNKKTGAKPTWILKLTVNSVDYYLSDNAYTITPWAVTTKSWITGWGTIQQGLSGTIGEYQVSDFTVSCLVDKDSSPNIEDMCDMDIEESVAKLYLWFHGTTDDPILFYTGNVRDVEQSSDTSIVLTLQDESVNYANKYLGTKITTTDYPEADPDDIGKIMPIVIGSPDRVPSIAAVAGAVTSIPNSISASATSFDVSDATALEIGDVIQIDDENLYITNVVGDTITVTRAYNSTTATTHQRGALVLELQDYSIYILAGHPVDSVDKLVGRVGQSELDISDIATVYTSGNVDFPGIAVAYIPGVISVQQAIDLLINDGIIVDDQLAIDDTISVDDTLTIDDALTIIDSIAVNDTISVSDTIALANGDHSHTTDIVSSHTQYGNALPQSATPTTASTITLIPSWPTLLGTPVETTYNFTVYVTSDNTAVPKSLYIQPSSTDADILVANTIGDETHSWRGTISGYEAGYPRIKVTRDGNITTTYVTLTDSQRDIVYDGSIDNTVVSKDGTVTKTGAATKSGTVDRSGSVDRSGNITKSGTVDRSGGVYKVGTVTASGNSTANTLIADVVLASMTKTYANPSDAISGVFGVSVEQFGSLPASYELNGAIVDYRTYLEWLNRISFQLRCYGRFYDGKWQLFVRPDSLSNDKTIPYCAIDDTGRLQWSRMKTDRDDVINKISLKYDKDWSNTDSEPFRGITETESATSISVFGESERPSLFEFEFVTDSTMADSLRDFYLTNYATRKWRHIFKTYLDNAEVEFMDNITLGFRSSELCEVESVSVQPGSYETIDTIEFTSR